MLNIKLSKPCTNMDTILPIMEEFWKSHSVEKAGVGRFLKHSVELFIKENNKSSTQPSNMAEVWSLLILFSGFLSAVLIAIIFLFVWLLSLDAITILSALFVYLSGFIFFAFVIASFDMMLKNQGRSTKDYFKLAIPFGHWQQLNALRQRFITDKIFRLEQINEFLETSHIPMLLERMGTIAGKLNARIKQDIDSLINDKNTLCKELDFNEHLSEQDKQEFRLALEEIDLQLNFIQNDRSHHLYSVLSEAEESVLHLREFNSKLINQINMLKGTQIGAGVAAKYIGYQSSLPKRLDEISNLAIEELNEIIVQSNKVLTIAMNSVPEVLVLNSGASPVTGLLEN